MNAPYIIDGGIQVSEAQVEKLVAERQRRRHIVLDGTYRFSSATSDTPHQSPNYLAKRERGRWQVQYRPDGPWVPHSWLGDHVGDECVRDGGFVPYAPPAPAFAVGDWVQRPCDPWPKARQVVKVENNWVTHYKNGDTEANTRAGLLRHATPEEIAAAKKIEPKVGLIVRENSDGVVMQYRGPDYGWYRLDAPRGGAHYVGQLTTDHYTVLDSYTVMGARP